MKLERMKRIRHCTVVLPLVFLTLTGCTIANLAVNPYDKITLIASEDINPDINERPSPVLVKVYHLSSRATFDNLDFDKLFFNGKQLLSDELILEKQYTLQPKQIIKDKLPLDKGTKFIAIVTAFRDIDHSRWRFIMPISDTHYYSHRLQITRNSILPLKVNSRKFINQPQIETATEEAKTTNDAIEQGKALSEKAENFYTN